MTTMCNVFSNGTEIQIINHSEPDYNGLFGTVMYSENVRGTIFYTVMLYDAHQAVSCTDDEIMEA
jgi:hypothetical protein